MSQVSSEFYAGWLYADLEEYDTLRDLGVFGPMIYQDFAPDTAIARSIGFSKEGTISYCICTKQVLIILVERYNEWWKENYIHYSDESIIDFIYPTDYFYKISTDWLKRKRSSEYTGVER